MADFVESTIKTFSGISSETKPTIAAGNTVPNGSRWREVDTQKTYHFDLATDTWYQSGTTIDQSTHATTTIEYEHHEIHSSSHYFVDGVADLSINEVLDFTWQMPNTTKWSHWTWHLSVEAETLYQIYETAVATNPLANVYTPLNNNRNSLNSSATVMRYEVQANLAGANADTNVTSATLIATGIIGAGRDGGFHSRTREIIMKQNTLYCLRSTASAAGYQNFTMDFYEHTAKA